MDSAACRKCFKGLFRRPGTEPDCVTRPVAEHDQPHIRSPLKTAAPISRLRRAGLGETKPFLLTVFQAIDWCGSPTWIGQDRSGPDRVSKLCHQGTLRPSST